MVLRAADALLTDFSGSAVDFMATGRPVISFVHDLADVADSLYYDLEHVMPGGVCRDFGELLGAMGHLFDEPSAHQCCATSGPGGSSSTTSMPATPGGWRTGCVRDTRPGPHA